MVKRFFDIVFSLFGLIIFSPAFLILAIAIKLNSKGPVFFRGTRCGLNGRTFKIFKFRTMVVNAHKLGGPSTADDDPRITKVGKFIRKYKIDEISQFINVLKGELSFVGPRPEVPMEVGTYNDEERKILTVKPGITDWASIKFHNEGEIIQGSENPHQAYREKIRPEKLRLGLDYVKNHSLRVDFKIITQTFLTLFITRFRDRKTKQNPNN